MGKVIFLIKIITVEKHEESVVYFSFHGKKIQLLFCKKKSLIGKGQGLCLCLNMEIHAEQESQD